MYSLMSFSFLLSRVDPENWRAVEEEDKSAGPVVSAVWGLYRTRRRGPLWNSTLGRGEVVEAGIETS